jgi:hypothetical protein
MIARPLLPQLRKHRGDASNRRSGSPSHVCFTSAQGYNDLNRKHRRALGTLVSRMFELFGKKLPGDPVEIAIALGRGMALMSKDGETNRSGRIVVTFLKALIGSAPSGA